MQSKLQGMVGFAAAVSFAVAGAVTMYSSGSAFTIALDLDPSSGSAGGIEIQQVVFPFMGQ